MIVHSEFHYGAVYAGFAQLRVFEEAIEALPEGVDKVFLTSDTQRYRQDLLIYCADGKIKRFRVTEFAIRTNANPEFKKAVLEVPDNDFML